jgi:hypothetical protein
MSNNKQSSIDKEFVPYIEAVALKELGFDETCFGYRDGAGSLMIKEISHCVISAPTFSQAFRWFREKYNLHFPIAVSDGFWFFERWRIGVYKTYEEAELACLIKLIEIVKGGNK